MSERNVSSIPDAELLRRAVTYARPPTLRKVVRWAVVRDIFGLGSTFSAQLCARFDLDPDQLINRRTPV